MPYLTEYRKSILYEKQSNKKWDIRTKLEIYNCVVCVVSKKNSQVVSWIEQSEIRDQRVLVNGLPQAKHALNLCTMPAVVHRLKYLSENKA